MSNPRPAEIYDEDGTGSLEEDEFTQVHLTWLLCHAC